MMYRFKKLIVQFSKYYNLDEKALALMRIGLGIVVILDLCIKGSDLFAFYSETGVLPSAHIYEVSGKLGMWSMCTWVHSNNWILLLYCINLLFAITFLLGYKTKWSNLFLWILTLSFQNRNLYILQAGDDLLRLILFWGMFLPWQNHFSFDQKSKHNLLSNLLGKLAYLILIASVYFFSVALKTSEQWHSQGTALYYSLSLEAFRTNAGDWLYQFPGLLKCLTHLVYYLEWLLPLFILWPGKKGNTRFYAFGVIIILHIGFALFLNVGLFFIISIVSAIGFLPNQLFSKIFSYKLKVIHKPKFLLPSFIFAFKNVVIITFIAFTLIVNLSSLNNFQYKPKHAIHTIINFLRFDQYWGMFAPGAPENNNWLVYMAYNAKGQQYDIQNNEEYVDFLKSKYLNSKFKSDRWRKFSENVQNEHYRFLRPNYCKYILTKWNNNHPEKKMSTLNLYSMEEKILPNYKREEPIKKILCVCDEN